MKVKISKRGAHFEVDPVDMPGSPLVGKGESVAEALAEFMIFYQARLGIEIEVDASVGDAEHQRINEKTADAARGWALY
ncbi:hypothetical protein [Pandoraea sp. ISTKB]|uniref:hypothetical protein n=1 Tax=Pandoraea sp. ISTKB TaxID=1586708 RepID=UPI000846529D|nr:hypothetical protein [Pandoraea sp. ISTKB]ODP35137.1 hypothetical protein A9762_12335 [Pandoraea sp. ISTKB]